MNKVFILIGRSASGKSQIQKAIHSRLGLHEVVSHTTREIRVGEIEGVDYFFVSPPKFLEYIDNGEMLEHTIYNGWYYGCHINQIDLSKGSYICVLNPDGYRQVVKKLGKENVVGIYIYADYWDLLQRSLLRQPNATKDQCVEICRRFVSDFDTFKGIEDVVDYKVKNDLLEIAIDEVVNIIKDNI